MEHSAVTCHKGEITWDDFSVFQKMNKRKKKEVELTENGKIIIEARQRQQFIAAERERLSYFRTHHRAAVIIQRAYKMFKFKTQGILKSARESIHMKRLDAGELEWRRQIAACTIQLAWRKYYRRKLLAVLNNTCRTVLSTTDADLTSLQQQWLVRQIYSETTYAPQWHPALSPKKRPNWVNKIPSAAAVSFNFAIEQYSQLQYTDPPYWVQGYDELDCQGHSELDC